MIFSSLRNGIRGALATAIVYPLTERYEKRDIRRKTAWVRKEIDMPYAQRRARAAARLSQLVGFAGLRVPYYRDLFASIGFDPAKMEKDVRFVEDIPYLTKDIIREQGGRMLRDDHQGLRIHTAKTGGSTGPSAHIYYDQEAADWSSAVTQESRRRIGNTHWRSELHFASKFPDVFPWRARMREHVKCFAMNRYNVFYSTFAAEELEDIWRQIQSIGPHLVHAHPSTVYQLAAHVEVTRGSDRAFDIFESSGELLEPRQRTRIEQILQCRVVDRYGLAEAGVIAYQLDPTSTDMRFYEFFAWPELLAENELAGSGSVLESPSGELVVTPLLNRMMPLLRYRTGDNARLREKPEGLVIPQMVGRIHDVVTLGGKPLPTHYIQDVLDRIGGIIEFQIELREGKTVFRLVPETGVDAEAIRQRLLSWWPDNIVIEFITLQDLKRVGHRQKFRHLVQQETKQ